VILLLCVIFLISGASALIFETLWFHQAGLALGNSVWASSLVLAGFMGGLALGSAAAVWRGDSMGPPIRTYAILEVVIALSGVSLVWLLPYLGIVTTPLLRPVLDQPWILNPVRLLLAFAFLLVPSTAMGLTLPLLTKALVVADPNFGRALGRLYGWNTLGAVLGAVVAEVVLIEMLGIRGSAFAAGSLNLLAAASAALIYRALRDRSMWGEGGRQATLRLTAGSSWLAAAFLAGFALLALEVVWFRFLLLSVLGTSLSFAVMLSVVLAGIALGGLFAGQWLRWDQSAHRFAVIMALAAGLLCTLTYAVFPTVIAPFDGGLIDGFVPVLLVSIPLMFPVSFLSGVFFTLAGSAMRREYPTATSTTGVLTFANTTGAAIGAFAGGFVLLPLLGMEASFFALALLYGVVGMTVLTKCQVPRRALVPVGGLFVLGLVLFPWGSMSREYLAVTAGRWSGGRDWQVVGMREGVSETILYVEEQLFGQRQHMRLVTNAYSMSSTGFFARRYMKLYVYLPVAIHPNPRQALLISYGVGSTAKALTDTDSFEAIHVVDISKDVLEMNSLVYPEPSQHPLNDPRVVVHVEDGRYFLQTTREKFDLITGEPPPPPMAGVVNLYTREYFELMRERLNEGGIVTYWLPLHALSEASAKAIIRAFCDAFPDASLWHGSREDVMLVGTRNASGPVSVDRFVRQWRQPHVLERMRGLGVEQPEQLGALFVGDIEFLRQLVGEQAALVDDHPKRIIAGFSAGAGGLFQSLNDHAAARERFEASALVNDLWPDSLRERTLPFFEYQRIVSELIQLAGHPLGKSIEDLHTVMVNTTLTAPVQWHMGSNVDAQLAFDRLTDEEQTQPLWQYQLAARLMSQRQFSDALEPLRNAEQLPDLTMSARIFRIYALCLGGQIREAQNLAQETYHRFPHETRLQGWWDFFTETYGVDAER
jgi:predicted membrane-bound spermidine synthase